MVGSVATGTGSHLAEAAIAGHATLPVARRLTVAIAATGDELAPPGTQDPGKLPETNGLMIAAMLRDGRGTVSRSPHFGPRWEGAPFGGMLHERLGPRFALGVYNDVNAVTWGEAVAGAARQPVAATDLQRRADRGCARLDRRPDVPERFLVLALLEAAVREVLARGPAVPVEVDRSAEVRHRLGETSQEP